MAVKTIIVDGQRGVIKTGILEALQNRLSKSKLRVDSVSLELVDFLLGSDRLQKLMKDNKDRQILIVDTKHILGLSHSYYGTKDISDYNVLSRSLAIVKAALAPIAVILVDGLADTDGRVDTRRGYLWEANQRGYHVVSKLADVEIVFDKLLGTLKHLSASSEPAVPLKDVLKVRQNKLAMKSRPKDRHLERKR